MGLMPSSSANADSAFVVEIAAVFVGVGDSGGFVKVGQDIRAGGVVEAGEFWGNVAATEAVG